MTPNHIDKQNKIFKMCTAFSLSQPNHKIYNFEDHASLQLQSIKS